MRKLFKIYSLILIFAMFLPVVAYSQSTSSPYSIFGLGLIEENSIGLNKAMGGTGIAFLSDRSVNMLNPASYRGIDSLLSIFEMGIFGKYTRFSTNKENQSAVDANFKYVLMGFRVTPWMAASFGFAPYSSVGYNINSVADVEGSNLTFNKRFTGEGGVNQTYFGSSFKITKNFSLGVNAAYLFGNITQTESSDTYYYVLSNVTYLSNLHLNYGLNYQFALKEGKFNIGLIFGDSKTLNTRNVTTIKTNTYIEETKNRINNFRIPRNYGIGLAYEKEYFKAGIDFERSIWKDIKFENSRIDTRNSDRYSIGVEFPSQGLRKGTSKMIYYRMGAEFQGSYFMIKDIPINYYAVTFGTGLPLKGALSTINISLELGQNGTTKKDLFRERFITLHLDLALRDLWFMKRRYL